MSSPNWTGSRGGIDFAQWTLPQAHTLGASLRSCFFSGILTRNSPCPRILGHDVTCCPIESLNFIYSSLVFLDSSHMKGLFWLLGIQEFYSLLILVEFLDAQVPRSIHKFHYVKKFMNFTDKNSWNSSKKTGPNYSIIVLGNDINAQAEMQKEKRKLGAAKKQALTIP